MGWFFFGPILLCVLNNLNGVLLDRLTANKIDDIPTTVSLTTIHPPIVFDDKSESLPLRIKRGDPIKNDQFIRFGRLSNRDSRNDNFLRLGKLDKTFLRLGRNPQSNFIRFGRAGNKFMRFGRNDVIDALRFGRRGDKFIRFGRSDGGAGFNYNHFVDDYNPEFEDGNGLIDIEELFGKRPEYNGKHDQFNRYGRKPGFIRLGRSQQIDGGQLNNGELYEDVSNSNGLDLTTKMYDEPDLKLSTEDYLTNDMSLEPNRQTEYEALRKFITQFHNTPNNLLEN